MSGEQAGPSGGRGVRVGASRTRVVVGQRRPVAVLGLSMLVILVFPLMGCAEAEVPQPFGPEQAVGSLAPDTVAALDAALADGVALAGASGAIAGSGCRGPGNGWPARVLSAARSIRQPAVPPAAISSRPG
ncbi:hypothetical protein [Cryobacterium sp.]|jgi:hypothetical protein|uniref:hypothetical protein n=1 Tax=Cryobacterium sp. TaxID=1926290 RepID=UPI0026384435|nr:hypothetical protein [Cryobacterium sp.]